MKRKLVKQGAATLMVSLPLKWAKRFDLKKGDEIDVEERGRHVVLKPKSGQKKSGINAFEAGNLLSDYIAALYESGHEEVHIDFGKAEGSFNFENLAGFDIVRQNENECILRQIADSESLEILHDKTFSMAVMFTEDCVSALKNQNYGLLSRMSGRNSAIKKYSMLCKRTAIRKSERNEKAVQAYCIIDNAEKIAGEFSAVAGFASGKGTIDGKYLELMEKTSILFNNLCALSKNFEIVVAASFADKLKEIYNEYDKLAVKSADSAFFKERFSRVLELLSDILRKLLMTQ